MYRYQPSPRDFAEYDAAARWMAGRSDVPLPEYLGEALAHHEQTTADRRAARIEAVAEAADRGIAAAGPEWLAEQPNRDERVRVARAANTRRQRIERSR
ncbi:hypothetical protein [Nocardia rhamnosiphila]|uniref:Uncharacterized protein n=1 Tax=Nocardia rhamnosiphila TaxID=426716 RepID=A0ABV2WZV2_9NOCA